MARDPRSLADYDPWHYLPALAKKPGALRNGDPFRNWDLPPAFCEGFRMPAHSRSMSWH
jgi:hypothetical protein